ncbi:inner membrane protein YbjM [Rouxiella sp. Mn2063]|uniref:inner membrane protein YbjM n=1 Tax=Rouxiella sp. Mn2063 TaxID=3395262 RepID=UPI003BD55DAC
MSRLSPLNTIIVSCVLFLIVFVSLKISFGSVNDGLMSRGNYGMLLYLLPGIITCFINRSQHVLFVFLGIIASIPFCLFIHNFLIPHHSEQWQEAAYLISAIFWAMLGVMLVLLYQICSEHIKRSH